MDGAGADVMAELLSLEGRTRPAQVNSSVVSMLTDILKEAQEGRIVSVALVSLDSDLSVSTWVSETDNFYRLLGGIEQMKFNMLTKHDADRA